MCWTISLQAGRQAGSMCADGPMQSASDRSRRAVCGAFGLPHSGEVVAVTYSQWEQLPQAWSSIWPARPSRVSPSPLSSMVRRVKPPHAPTLAQELRKLGNVRYATSPLLLVKVDNRTAGYQLVSISHRWKCETDFHGSRMRSARPLNSPWPLRRVLVLSTTHRSANRREGDIPGSSTLNKLRQEDLGAV